MVNSKFFNKDIYHLPLTIERFTIERFTINKIMNRREYIKNTALFLGYAVSASAMTDTFLACKNEAQANLVWKPIFFTNNQANLVAEITETILPKTATPGAKEIGVPQFIDKMMKDLSKEKDQKEFLEGLKNFDETCEKSMGKSFVACSVKERETFLMQQEKTNGKNLPNIWGTNMVVDKNAMKPGFYRQVKGLTVWGYFTSEKIGKDVLDYVPIPGKFIGEIAYTGQNNGSGD